jgi:UPF0042 nucleotide-binding protein
MKMAEMVNLPGAEIERVALVIGRGGGIGSEYFDDLPDVLDALRANRNRVRVLFLDASDDVLIRRYEGTRRRHPLAARGVEESIADERRLLAPVRDRADLLIDTGELNTNQLRSRMLEAFGDEGGADVHATSVVSFGYKYGSRSMWTWSSTAASCPTRSGSRSCGPSAASTSPCATTCSPSPRRRTSSRRWTGS